MPRSNLTKKIPGSVWILGIVSLFNDVASEMLYPVLPIFITQVLGAPVAVLGLIDGVAEGSAALFKTIFGRWSDRLGKRKPFVFYGYLASTVSKVVIALSRTWGLVFVGRVLDKFGKGIRIGARDALLLDASSPTNRAVHRRHTFDHWCPDGLIRERCPFQKTEADDQGRKRHGNHQRLISSETELPDPASGIENL